MVLRKNDEMNRSIYTITMPFISPEIVHKGPDLKSDTEHAIKQTMPTRNESKMQVFHIELSMEVISTIPMNANTLKQH